MHSCFIRIGAEILVPKKVCFPRTHLIQCDLCELGNANDNSDDLNDDGDGEWQNKIVAKKSAPSKSRVEIPNLTTSLNLVVERGGYLSPIFAGTA